MTEDERFMLQAIALGERARGTTGDNPYVGCVIVHGDQLLGEGRTQPPGQHHAEIAAILEAERRGHDLTRATLYSTLEPCCFEQRTPACTSAIIARRIPRVVIGILDPHPRVRGRGISQLQAAGVEVVQGICPGEVRGYLGQWLESFYPGLPGQ